MVIASCVRWRPDLSTAWVLLFVSAALACSNAGSARSLLHYGCPVILLFSLREAMARTAFAAQMTSSLALASVIISTGLVPAFRELD